MSNEPKQNASPLFRTLHCTVNPTLKPTESLLICHPDIYADLAALLMYGGNGMTPRLREMFSAIILEENLIVAAFQNKPPEPPCS